RGFTWIPFEHQVQLKVKTEEPVYKSGKKIGTITNLSFQKVPPPGTKLFLGLTDCRGRVLQKDTPKLAASKKTIETVFTMPEGGPERVSSYWITAVCRNGDQILGKSRPVQIQRNDRWGMRRQFQFSVWSRGGPEPYMKLLRDAGFNALGMQGNPATEDQYGIRSYREGLSRRVSTFSVEIKHPTWKETRDWMEKAIEKERQKQGPASRARCLLSLQEEGGFKGGWGRRYYWKEKTAPPVAQKMFAGYLREIYEGDIKTLNREWNVDYEDFDEIPLRKDYLAGRRMKKVNIHAEAWEGGKQTEQKGGERPPEDKTDVTSPYLAHAAPYKETYHFFDWYYQKYCDMAVEVYRKYRNPVPLTICSAPGGFYPKVDVYNFRGQGPFRPKERGLLANTRARRRYGDIPGFGLHWAYFDLRPLWESVLFSSILAGNTHIDYWVDMPLSLNADLTHTRASQWTSELREQLRPIEPILLHKRIRYTPGLGIYGADRESYGALEESGYMPRSVGPEDFDEISVLVAGAKKLDRPAAEKLVTFVRNGGLLISSPQIGSESAHGNPLRIYPPEKSPLTDILGFRLLATSHKLVKKRKAPTIELSIEHEAIPVQNVAIRSRGRDRVMNMEDDIEVVAEYENGDPLILTRKVGRGRVIHLNFMHDWYHWWNTFYEPSREAYRKLIKSILEADGRVKAEHYIGFRSAEKTSSNNGWWGMKMDGQPARDEAVPWWASQLYSDPSGRRRYLAVFSDHRSPIITAKINWEGEKGAVYGLLTGQQITMEDGGWTAQLRPGEARLWAIVPDKTDGLQVELPAGISGAGPLEIEVRPATEKSEAISGCMVDVYGPSGERLKSKSLLNGQVPPEGTTLRIPFADNDPAGKYCLRVTESLTRKTQQLTIRFQPGNSPARSTLCPFPPRADDLWQSQEMDHEDFLDAFRRLREIYLGSYEGLETRYMLSYYLHVPFRPDNRHGIVRDLHRTSWEMHLKVFAEALRAGEKFYLLAEDLNIDPHSGLRIDPLAGADPQRFIERLEKQNGAERETRIIDGIHFRIIRIGEGALIVGQISNDRNIYTPSDYQKWHESLKSAFQKLGQ
ncbi:MAG: hypothetical protein KGZ25_05210, partial [Planctomycetes bacterium]|nr:hypothetical protein [Planctomycetota bacterium]